MKATKKQLSWVEYKIKQLRNTDPKVKAEFPDEIAGGLNKVFITLNKKLEQLDQESIGLVIGLLRSDRYYMRAIKLLKKLTK